MVVRYIAVNQVEDCPGAVVDPASTLPVISGVRLHRVLCDNRMIERQGTIVENAAGDLPAIAVRDDEMAHCRGGTGINDEYPVGMVTAEGQPGRSGAIDLYILPQHIGPEVRLIVWPASSGEK